MLLQHLFRDRALIGGQLGELGLHLGHVGHRGLLLSLDTGNGLLVQHRKLTPLVIDDGDVWRA